MISQSLELDNPTYRYAHSSLFLGNCLHRLSLKSNLLRAAGSPLDYCRQKNEVAMKPLFDAPRGQQCSSEMAKQYCSLNETERRLELFLLEGWRVSEPIKGGPQSVFKHCSVYFLCFNFVGLNSLRIKLFSYCNWP